MAAKCHCKKPGECEECPEWIFTFADLVMLMMGFFVILWVLKPAGNPKAGSPEAAAAEAKWIDTVSKIRETFGYVPDPKSKDPVDVQMLRSKMLLIKPMNDTPPAGQTLAPHKGADGTDTQVQAIRPSDQSLVGGRIFFDPGSAALNTDDRHQLDQIVQLIRGYNIIVLVKGHTALDDFPQADPPRQMDLSLRRAGGE